MINDKEKIVSYFESLVNGIYKILPLYEEQNDGIDTYIESLLFTLYKLDKAIDIHYSRDYITVLATLEAMKSEIEKDKIGSVNTIRRETFKCMNIVKSMAKKIKEGA